MLCIHMSFLNPQIPIRLHFHSIADIYQFKHECTCRDFYIDNDAIDFVGDFSKEEVQLAKEKYKASPRTAEEQTS